MEKFFKIGDKVTCLVKGWGIVEEIVEDATYPIHVRFCNSSFYKESYTYDGKFLTTGNSTLLQGHVNLDEIIPKNKPLHDFEDGELVWLNINRDAQNTWVTAYTEIDKMGRTLFRVTFSHVFYWESEVKEVRKFNDCPLKLNKNS